MHPYATKQSQKMAWVQREGLITQLHFGRFGWFQWQKSFSECPTTQLKAVKSSTIPSLPASCGPPLSQLKHYQVLRFEEFLRISSIVLNLSVVLQIFSRVRLCECWNDKLEEMPFLLPGILASHISSSCPENFAELIERMQTGLTFAYTSQCPYSNANEFICICMHTHVRDQNTYIHL